MDETTEDEGIRSREELAGQYDELERDHTQLQDDYAAVLTRLNETRRERDTFRDQLTTIHTRTYPHRRGWACTCDHGVMGHDGDGRCLTVGCACPESVVEIRARCAAVAVYAWTNPLTGERYMLSPMDVEIVRPAP